MKFADFYQNFGNIDFDIITYVKSQKKDNVSNTFLRDSEGNLQNKPSIKANIFSEQFSSVFSPPNDNNPTIRDPQAPAINDLEITTNGVQKLMKNLDHFKASGPDKVPPYILKELADQMAPVYQILFQASIDQGIVPNDWKKAHITPIFKKGDPSRQVIIDQSH